ncbi:MAG: BatA domain-containing protein [Flavobacteriaceae bacterium]|nr:BatA domain-containing protein [Flavobacteriaceae bacterium]
MQFKHPEILYALLLLVIPIIVHLFQLRRFQKEAFTNVAFLKSVVIQTRKSSKIKKWLTLLTRLFLLACIIIAFSQPYFTNNKDLNTKVEYVIYLDNSFSMQAKGAKGALLKRAIQDILTTVDNTQELSVFTNDITYKNTNILALKNELIQLDYSPNQLPYDAVLIKGKQLFSKGNNTLKHLILISDFQKKNKALDVTLDSSTQVSLVQLIPQNLNNISLDSVYISGSNSSNLSLDVAVTRPEQYSENLSISLYEKEHLIAKTAITTSNDTTATFSLPLNQKFNGRVVINDESLQFDNTLYFNINATKKINVLSINEADDNYLSRIYSKDEFNYKSIPLNALNFNVISNQNLIILNELNSISTAVKNALISFKSKGGNILIIPSINSNKSTYNQMLSVYDLGLDKEVLNTKNITNINYGHPLFENVFESRVSNFQYPKVNQFYNIKNQQSAILNYEDSSPFLVESNGIFLFTAALNSGNSNFTNSQLIVPVLYNIGKQSLKLPKLYYELGKENIFDIDTQLGADEILSLKCADERFIPQQQNLNNKVVITTNELPRRASIYEVLHKTNALEHVSFNYPRHESRLKYESFAGMKHVDVATSIPELLETIKNDTNNNALWKWFVIFALTFLVIEMFLLKYFK